MPNKSLKLDLLLGLSWGLPFWGIWAQTERQGERGHVPPEWGLASPSLVPRPCLPAEAFAHRARRPPAPGCQCLPPALP